MHMILTDDEQANLLRLRDWLKTQQSSGSIDESLKLKADLESVARRIERQYDDGSEEKAQEYRDLCQSVMSGGDIEMDDDCTVSFSEDGGAYVQCWKWIYDPDKDEDDDAAE